MVGRRLHVLIVVLGAISTGCEEGRHRDGVESFRDSAGVRILWLEPLEELPEPRLLVFDSTWWYGADVEVGDLEDVEVTADGGVILLDRLAARIVVLSVSGSEEASFGRVGEGPGELNPRGLSELVHMDSFIAVPDLIQRRVVQFDLSGRVMDTRAFPAGFYPVDWRAHPGGGLAYRLLEQGGDLIIHWEGAVVDTLFRFDSVATPPNTLLAPVSLWDLGLGGELALARSDRWKIEMKRQTEPWIVWFAGSEVSLNEGQRVHLEQVVLESARQQGAGSVPREEILRQVHIPPTKHQS